MSWLSFVFITEPSFWIFFVLFFAGAFCLGYYWQGKESRVKLLIEEANFRTKQILELEKVNQELEKKNRELYAKELELTMANSHLQTLEQAKSKFISVTTHQLRTPLAAVKWTLDMAAKGELGVVDEEQKKFLGQGLSSVNRVISIVNDLLKIDSIDASREEYNFEPTDIVKLLDDVFFEFNNQASLKKIKLVIKKPVNVLPHVDIDADKIRMVLENLIDNALKYTPVGGQVTVQLSDARINNVEGALEVSVSDSGIGIPSGETSKVFQKFFRATNAIKNEPDGSGLGLFIAHDIIEKHNGSIWFKTGSASGQAGTTFSFTLPLHQKKYN
ncbi:MAG TPA: HAMP domain-containing sensor histidine kinase [Candidatus Paceibacterota bacterium]|nr:HAMP domain-containing sensor histidine kinase [Candidatus Paceibacterota bacterium]